MQQLTTLAGGWACARDDSEFQEDVGGKIFSTVLGIIKDSLVMSVVVMMGAVLTLLLG